MAVFLATVLVIEPESALGATVEADWEERLGSETLSYRYMAGVASAGDTVWAVMEMHGDRLLLGLGPTSLWKLDTRQRTWTECQGLLEEIKAASSASRLVQVGAMGNGTLALIVEDEKHRDHLQLVDGVEGKVRSSRPMGEGLLVNRIIATSDGGGLLIGRNRMIKLNSAGDVAWNKAVPLGDDFSLFDGVSLPAGGFVLLGTQMQMREGMGQAWVSTPGAVRVWLARVNPDGDVLQTEAFPGRMASLTGESGGRFVVVYDSVGGLPLDLRAERDIWVRRVGSDLKMITEKRLFAERYVSIRSRFRAAFAGGNVIVVGHKEWKPWIGRVTTEGELKGELRPAGVGLEMVDGLDLLRSEAGTFAVFSVAAQKDNRLRYGVRVIKLKVPGE